MQIIFLKNVLFIFNNKSTSSPNSGKVTIKLSGLLLIMYDKLSLSNDKPIVLEESLVAIVVFDSSIPKSEDLA